VSASQREWRGLPGRSRLLPIRTAPAVVLTIHLRPVIAMGCLRTDGSVSDSEERGPSVQRTASPVASRSLLTSSARMRARSTRCAILDRNAGSQARPTGRRSPNYSALDILPKSYHLRRGLGRRGEALLRELPCLPILSNSGRLGEVFR